MQVSADYVAIPLVVFKTHKQIITKFSPLDGKEKVVFWLNLNVVSFSEQPLYFLLRKVNTATWPEMELNK